MRLNFAPFWSVPESKRCWPWEDYILASRIIKHIVITFFSLAPNLGRNRFNRLAGTGYFPHDSRHFVPGYYQPVPPGQKPFAPWAPRVKLTLMGMRSRASGAVCLDTSLCCFCISAFLRTRSCAVGAEALSH